MQQFNQSRRLSFMFYGGGAKYKKRDMREYHTICEILEELKVFGKWNESKAE